MAAGRRGNFSNNESRVRESEFEVSRRVFAYSRGEYDRIRNGGLDYERDQIGDRGMGARVRVRVRQKDIKEREVINDGYHLSSSRSNSGSSGDGAVRAEDREPGELSSESGSDEAIDIESHVEDNEVDKLENGTRSHMESKKRKFSPIVWDRDAKDTSNSSESRIAPVATTFRPPPSLPRSYRQSSNVILDKGVEFSSLENGKLPSSEASPVEPTLAFGSHVSAPSESPLGLYSSSPGEQRWGNYHKAEELGDEEYPLMRNISASRWADDVNSPAVRGEFSDDEKMPKKRKKTPLSELVETRLQNKSPSPELGEVKREGSEGTTVRSSESEEGGVRVRSSRGDDYPDNDLDTDDYMEIDEERYNNGTSVSYSDADSEDERGSLDTPEAAAPLQRSVNMLQGCRSVEEFERLNRINEGTYGVVYRARDKKTGEIVALKKVKMEKEREGFPMTSLREINILLSFHHPSVVDVKEVVVGSNLDSIFMVMEYMEHDLKGLMDTMKQPFSQSEVKCLMLQLLEGVKYLHDNWVLHRDLKTSNLLLNNRGELKICDFGLARQYGSPLKPYTHLVVTLWYRAPELLLGAKQYSMAIDMWSLGCIMAELLSKEPLFNGKAEFEQLDKIFRTLGTPNETIWPGFSKLPGVKVKFCKHQLPALGDSGIIYCVENSLLHLLPALQFSLILDLTY
ncbi:cyclin-dependent kinase G-2-like isoform X2 [Cornus florida]|uniref:cyclin-dependent kinase G-2-like isoform X2 n=1 Tax=Cornus florida TaxID=4283 RepID=UPI002898D268|nr:cyclin-dependent kinase G-2-like isoform X2 [Cornus florida]